MIADLFDCFFFDLDGVLYVGGETTPGAAESLDPLRSMGKAIRFLTNNPTTRVRIADRLRGHGIAAEMDEIVTAGSATAKHLAERGIMRAWVIGEAGLHREVEMGGILPAGEKDWEAVVLGWDETATLAAVRRAAAPSTSVHSTCAPAATSARHRAAPIPEPAPVTIACFPAGFPSWFTAPPCAGRDPTHPDNASGAHRR